VAAIGARIIAVGVNSFRCHPMAASDPKRESSFHAEIAALRQLREVDSRTTLFVARVAKNGQTALSAPCANCRQALKEAGLVKIIFSVDGEGYGVLKL
jgi:cytidine deaminase